MKKLLITLLIGLMTAGLVYAGEVKESVVIDNALTHKQDYEVAKEPKRQVNKMTYSHAETAKNFRNWVIRGANEGITHMRGLAPRGHKAPTVQMNHDSLYSVAITKIVDGKVRFEIPKNVEVYTAVQVIDQWGHGQEYIVEEGKHTVDIPVGTHAFLIFRSGLEKGIEGALANQDKLTTWGLVSGDFEVPNYDFDEVEAMTANIRKMAEGKIIYYTFPRTEEEVTDRDQWNLENAIGWGGSSPEVGVANLYTNTPMLDGSKCMSTTFEDPKSKYFSSITVYDKQRYLFEDEDIKSMNSHWWTPNEDGSITISFNCGEDAINNITTKGKDFMFTSRYYGVTQAIIDASKKGVKKDPRNPNLNVVDGTPIKTRKASCRCGQLNVTYKGPDPERITLCHCNSCQLRTSTVFSVQARFPRDKVKIVGKSTKWTFPSGSGERVTYRSCDSGGATYHFCPVCGSTVYWDIAAAPNFIGVAIGAFTDPTFPPPKISGFESYGHPWAMKAADLPIKRLDLAE
jgi:hypothetical protein